jgi:hypothetical protein
MGKVLIGLGLVFMAAGVAVYGLVGDPLYAGGRGVEAGGAIAFLSFIAGAVVSAIGGRAGSRGSRP